MGRWDEALDRFERGSVLLQPGTALLKAALEGGRRAGANRDVDRKVKGKVIDLCDDSAERVREYQHIVAWRADKLNTLCEVPNMHRQQVCAFCGLSS